MNDLRTVVLCSTPSEAQALVNRFPFASMKVQQAERTGRGRKKKPQTLVHLPAKLSDLEWAMNASIADRWMEGASSLALSLRCPTRPW